MKSSVSSFAAACFILICVFNCAKKSEDKSNVEEQNQERFDSRKERKEAQFVVDAIDASYAVIEAAQLGEQRATTLQRKGCAKKIIEGQTTIINRLKTYAEDNDISVPFFWPLKNQSAC